MKAILTGATGYIGSNLKKHLEDKGWRVETIGRKDSSEMIDSKMKEVRPDVVFHLATHFLSEHQSSDLRNLIESNITFGASIVEAMTRNGISRFVNTGTAWQYFGGKNETPSSLYAATKSAFEDILRYYCSARNLKSLTLVLSDTYGPRDPRAKILPKLLSIAGSEEHLELSPGEQVLSWTYIADVLNAFEIAACRLINGDEESDFSKYSAYSDEVISLKETVAECEKATGKKIHVTFGAKAYRAREVMQSFKLDPKLPKWNAGMKFKDGLKECLRD